MHLKLLRKTAEATGDLIGNKIANKITKVSKKLETVRMKMIKKYLKKDICVWKKDNELLMI